MYTIKEASARSGVGVPLLRAWERRYGVVEPIRTSSGYRLYDDEAIARLSAMRHLTATGWSARQAAEHVLAATAAELASLTEVPRDESTSHDRLGDAATDASSLSARLVRAARDLDATALESMLDEAFAAGRFESVAERLLMPALRALGDAWQSGEVSIAGEHAASHAVLRRLAMAYEAAGDSEGERPILVGLGAGGRHELGALAFATAARRAGLPVLYLGGDLPPESWVSAARERSARAAVVGVPTRADVPRARDVLSALRGSGLQLVLAVGGEEAPRVARGDDAVELPRSLTEGVATLRAALSGRGRRREAPESAR